jgi:hypothetical protein
LLIAEYKCLIQVLKNQENFHRLKMSGSKLTIDTYMNDNFSLSMSHFFSNSSHKVI